MAEPGTLENILRAYGFEDPDHFANLSSSDIDQFFVENSHALTVKEKLLTFWKEHKRMFVSSKRYRSAEPSDYDIGRDSLMKMFRGVSFSDIRRTFSTSTLTSGMNYLVDPAVMEGNRLVALAQQLHKLIMVTGPRQVGKSTHALYLMAFLPRTFTCRRISLQSVCRPSTASELFQSLGSLLQMGEVYNGETMISRMYDHFNRYNSKLVLILEEFGQIFSWPADVRQTFLAALRSWCQTDPPPVWSVVCVGSHLMSLFAHPTPTAPGPESDTPTIPAPNGVKDLIQNSRWSVPPFNLEDIVFIPSLPRDGVESMFAAFVAEHGLQGTGVEVAALVEECMAAANGLAGIVQSYGATFQRHMSGSRPASKLWEEWKRNSSECMMEAAKSSSAMVEARFVLGDVETSAEEAAAMVKLIKDMMFVGRVELPSSNRPLELRVAMHCLDAGFAKLENKQLVFSCPVFYSALLSMMVTQKPRTVENLIVLEQHDLLIDWFATVKKIVPAMERPLLSHPHAHNATHIGEAIFHFEMFALIQASLNCHPISIHRKPLKVLPEARIWNSNSTIRLDLLVFSHIIYSLELKVDMHTPKDIDEAVAQCANYTRLFNGRQGYIFNFVPKGHTVGQDLGAMSRNSEGVRIIHIIYNDAFDTFEYVKNW
eukprot:GILK01009671.1.p1 GENE.GILK01009671.1~~GILK01009671.1.p1  ORF type:complete len:654 (+),score=62.81 GILK01009671.1:199-2160(+)